MTVYRNRQGNGLWIVFKYFNGKLDTGSHNGSYSRKPPARTYNTIGHARAQWNRFIKEGYGAEVAEISFDEETGQPRIEIVSDAWVSNTQLCKFNKFGQKCLRRKGHDGIHWSGIEAKRDPDFDPTNGDMA